jgi:AcrR family transcriptional regulator
MNVTSQKRRTLVPGETPAVARLMGAAKALFFRFGIRKVSVEEICREAGLSKMTFYRHFKDKDEIAIRVLTRYFCERMEIVEMILQEEAPFVDKLRRIAALKMKALREAGDETVREVISDRESKPGQALGKLLESQARRTKRIFIDLQKKGDLRKDIRVELILSLIEGLWKALSDESLVGLYQDKSRLYEELFEAVYFGLLPQNGTRTRRESHG